MRRQIILALAVILGTACASPLCKHIVGDRTYDLTALMGEYYSEYELSRYEGSVAKYKWSFCAGAEVSDVDGACEAADGSSPVLAIRLPLDGACEVVARVDDCKITPTDNGVAYECSNHKELCQHLDERVPREFSVFVGCDPRVEWSSVPVLQRSPCVTRIQAKSKYACSSENHRRPVVANTTASTTGGNSSSSGDLSTITASASETLTSLSASVSDTLASISGSAGTISMRVLPSTTTSTTHGTSTTSSATHGTTSTTHGTSSTSSSTHGITSTTHGGPSTSTAIAHSISLSTLTSTTGSNTPLCCIYNITKHLCVAENRCPQLIGYKLETEFRVSDCDQCTLPHLKQHNKP